MPSSSFVRDGTPAASKPASARALGASCELLCATEHTDFVRCVGFDHLRIVTTSDDGTVRLLHFDGGAGASSEAT